MAEPIVTSPGFLGLAKNQRDALLPLAIIGILIIMVVPVAPWMMDLLLTLSITTSLLILFVGIYINKPLDFSVFPSLLLIVTLLRLALNVGTTRLILLHGNEGTHAAGGLIEAFGNFVVGGNYVVGLIIFMILIVINFMVITKGAGRVAEVSARFTLDAMPGKQMSIDADLNAGLINEGEARSRRKTIELEADFYGAMDGASKFVRGDAIAGIVILVINIVGGLVIGILQHGMSPANAATNYTLLTVGDGLVSQIPALIVSTAAGLVVTRATHEGTLSQTMGQQLFLQPRAMGVASAMLMVFSVIPGMPTMPFLILAGMTGFAAWAALGSMKRKAAVELETKQKAAKLEKPKAESDADLLAPLDLVSLEVGYGLIGLVDQEQKGDLLDRIRSLRRQLAQEWGFVIPPVHIRDNLEFKPTSYALLIKGCVVASADLMQGHLMAMAADDNDGRELGGIQTTEPAFGLPAVWIPEAKREQAQALGYTVVDASTIIIAHLAEVLKNYAHELLTRQETQNLIDGLAKKFPKVVEGVIPDILPLGLIQRVLQNLLAEHVSIRDFLTIIETMTDRAPSVKDSDLLTEYVRQGLARHITKPYLDEVGRLRVMMLDREVEELLMRHTRMSEAGLQLTLDPESAQRILTSLEQASENWQLTQGTPILTCLPACRAPLRRLVEKFLPSLVILSHNEIPPSVRVETLRIVGLNHAVA
ncbi:flagellar biosynthesis protein FlhA [bacterium]|nr:flagellar biosynthesis protein FlhA [bacterium]